MRFVPVLAVLVLGLALYVTRGVLDQVLTGTELVRVALFPPLPALGGFLGVGLLGLLWLDRRAVPRGTATAVRPPIGPLLLPTFGLVVLLLPYLPVLPDWIPALQTLAGPLRGIVWLAIGMQLVWALWQARLLHAGWVQRWTVSRMAIVIAVATFLGAGIAAARLTGTVLFPAGDEPHYLVIAQSLWRDGDLKIENNHQQEHYREYFPRELDPHYLTRGADGEIYSIHPVGLPVLMAPVYALGGYRAVVFAILLMAAMAAGLMWRHVVAATNAAGAATFAWAAIVFTAPFLFNAFAVYPEIAAALAAALALTLATAPSASPGLARWLIAGVACAALPWLSTKYAPMSAALVAVALARILWPATTSAPGTSALRTSALGTAALRTSAPAAAAVLVPYGCSLVAWFSFFYVIWGTPLPQAPYGDLVQTDVFNLVFGAPGLLFDQEYGLLPYAPVYIFALTGLIVMLRDADQRRRAMEITLVFAALLGTVGAFRIWWGGSASPGRPLTSGLLLLALPIAIAFRAAPAGSARRAAQHLLLWIGIGISLVMLFAQNGLLISNGRDGTSSLLAYLSPRWPAWSIAPSFIHHEAGTAWLHSLGWLALAALAAWGLARVRTARPGAASLWASVACSAALLVAVVVFPAMPFDPPWPGVDVAARARLPMLDAFDATARPIAIAYTPAAPMPAAGTISRAILSVTPGARTEPQPIRVLHNGRFTMPAGRYRVDVDWSAARSGETIGLQVGRTGEAWRTWNVEPRPGERWSMEFTLPLDASFVGLRGTPELERTIGRITFVPLSVVDAGRRPRAGTVIGASQFGPVAVFYYDANAFPEGGGFWVRGGGTTRVTFARAETGTPLTLRVHSGLITNKLRVATIGWSQEVTLQPKLRDDVEIPTGDRPLVTLDLRASSAFIPSQLDPAAKDDRPLGVWVEIVR
jgi:hypothetical protein